MQTIKTTKTVFTIIILVLGWGGWLILKSLFPQTNMLWYPYLPVTFFVMGMLLAAIMEKVNKDNPRKLVNIYMLLKFGKYVIVLAYILLYYFLVRENIRLFLLFFAVYYVVYLLFEFYVFYITEKKIKQSK